MILTQLKEYADTRITLPPPMYGETKIAWLINLTSEGEYDGWTCLKDSKNKALKRGKPMVVPHIGRTVGVKPKLLADTGEYVLGIARSTSKPERVAECHQQFKVLLKACVEDTSELLIGAISTFLNGSAINDAIADIPDDFDPSEVVTFRIDGFIPANAAESHSKIEQFWANYTASSESSEKKASNSMTCLVTGKPGTVEQRLPFLVKGLIGGQPSGTALVSANSAAFASYGLKNSLTSPISREAAESFTKALNELISSNQSRMYVGSTAYIYWTKEEDEFDPLSFIDKPEPQDVTNLLSSPFTAQRAASLEVEGAANEFYALALSANNARSVIRDWLETTVPRVQAQLKAWFEGQRLVDTYGQPGRPLGIYTLAASVYRDPSKEMLPAVPTALVRSALHGERLPHDLLVRLVRRNRVERDVTYPRAVLTKLIFTFDPSNNLTMANMEQLNETSQLGSDDPAYQCGRLLAELEAIQRTALGSVNASLTDRYYGAASSTPVSAFPPLMRGARAHLSKLRKTMPGACNRLEESLEIITCALGNTFPKTLNMQQQGIFSLGYYHQRAANRAAAKAAKEAKKAKTDS
ncbi:MAG: type I-C CRISPR-associated protein Cas8c/Csd1 [Cyanobacteria bacterium P01_F01_bin.86]